MKHPWLLDIVEGTSPFVKPTSRLCLSWVQFFSRPWGKQDCVRTRSRQEPSRVSHATDTWVGSHEKCHGDSNRQERGVHFFYFKPIKTRKKTSQWQGQGNICWNIAIWKVMCCLVVSHHLIGSPQLDTSQWLGFCAKTFVVCTRGKKTKDGKKLDCKTSTPGSMSVGGLWYEWIYNNAILPPKQYPISEGYSNPIRTNTCD